MSENICCPQVEVRGFGEKYGEILQCDLISINYFSVSVRFPDNSIINFCLTNGHDEEYLFDNSRGSEYSGYQLNLDSLVFDKNFKRNYKEDTLSKINPEPTAIILETNSV
jgi:hypothetical protein